MRTKKMLDLTPPKWTLIVNKKINSWYYGWNYLKWIVYKEPNPKILQTFKQKKKSVSSEWEQQTLTTYPFMKAQD